MRESSLTGATLQRLAGLDSDGHEVLSLYLDMDPGGFPHVRDRRMQADSLLEEAERAHAGEGQGHGERMALRDDLAQVRAYLTDERLAPASARGLAIFCCAPAEIFEVVALARAAEPAAIIAARPFVEPLLELFSPERWCALLVSRRAARTFRGTRERLRELASVRDEVHVHHAQGGWSQAGYQRGVEQEVDWHLGRACSSLYERFQRSPFERLLLGCPEELRHRVEETLHPDLRRLLAGHFDVDVERASAEEVHRRALPLIEACERDRERAALAQLREGMAPKDHAAAGLDEVLELLAERRVRTLLVAHGAHAEGFACPRCGRLSVGAGQCPADGAGLQEREDVIENAIEAALAQDAEIVLVRHHVDELAAYGPVAALLRF